MKPISRFLCFIIILFGQHSVTGSNAQNGPPTTTATAAVIEATSPQPKSRCPERCVCEKVLLTDPAGPVNGYLVNCRDDRFTSFLGAMQLPENIYSLDLSRNSIKTLSTTDTMDSLQKLDLEGNGLTIIDPEAFEGLPNLRDLNLGFNNLTDIPNKLFAKNMELRVLRLTSNHIRHLSEDIFSSNIQMEELSLRGNPLIHIYPDWFRYMNSLLILDLADTGMYALPAEAFHYTHSLRELDLSDNQFDSVPTMGLRSAQGLRKLKLNRNPIRALTEDSFNSLSQIEELEVCQMPHLVDILAMTFADQTSLINLTITDNPHLVYLDRLAFYGMFNATHLALKTLNLHNNRLSTLSHNSLRWCDLDKLDLERNPFKCDCKLAWLPTCKPLLRGPRCAEPDIYRGLEVHKVEPADFKCSNRYHGDNLKIFRIFVILFGAVIIFFVGLSLVLVFKRNHIVRWWSERKRGTGSIYYVKANSIPGDSQVDI